MLVNGQMPGPAIKASWGDTVVVKVNNKLQTNGTSIHFHGVRQLNNNMNDGVPSITQCPIAPGSSMTYTWVAENYGTSWYHSHFAIQAWEGVMGPVIIDGPHSAEFDIDLGPFQIQDWSHFTVDSRYDLAQNATPIPDRTDGATFGGPVLLDTGLINGKNIWNGPNQNSTPIGERLEVTLTPNKKHLLRVINSAIQSTYKFYLDGHSFTVIASDFVPITPYTTTVLNINIGQRYDIIVEANQPADNYFLRADNQQACSGTVQAKDIRAIVRYDSTSTGIPTSTAYNYTEECVDELLTNLVPVVPLNPTAADITEGALDVVVAANDVQLFKWFLSGTTFFSQYGDPTLLDIFKTNTVPNYSGNLLVELPDAGKMVYVIVESPIPLPHPLHLHGHDFW
jgi:FtsP/CotA-like multicopper oxidase with cupredoxin domain